MKPLGQYHPFTIFIYFFAVILLTGIHQEPVLTIISCVVSTVTFYVCKKKQDRSFAPIALLCLLAGLINPLVSHHGATILFYINDIPITAEAGIYGVFLALRLLQLIMWFKILSLFITSEHIMCLLGRLSPRLALLFSMVLRFVPDFSMQFTQVENASKVRGLYTDDSLWTRILGKARTFLSVAGYALEKGVITADSMEARGYSLTPRTSYMRYKLRHRDAILISLILLLSAPMIIAKILGIGEVAFYPEYLYVFTVPGALMVLLPGALLTLIPITLCMKELPWKS